MKHLLHSFMLFLCLFIWQNALGQVMLVASGDLTSSITWSIEQTGSADSLTLVISGTGDMPDFSSYTAMPWNDYKSQITEVNISSGITKIGDYSFRGTAITSVDIPSTCTTIGKQAFGKCEELREIYIPESVTSVGSFAFALCKNLCLVHYDGRCTNENRISLNGVRANGKFIEKEGTGASVITSLPSSWEYYTHKEQCVYGAWVAESGTGDNRKLFFYAQKPEAMVSYAPNEGINSQEDPIAHPWRVNCDKYTSIEINRNVSAISKYELVGYEDPNTGVVKGYSNVQTITVESGSPYFVVGEDGVLYNKAKSTLYLYPATKTATHFDVPKAVKNIGFGAFCGAKNLLSISFHSTLNNISFSPYAFANASSLCYMSFAKDVAPSAPESAFQGLPTEGVVVAPTETDEYKEFTKTVGSNWTFCASSADVVSYISSDGTLYVAGNGEYNTESSDASWYDQRSSIKKIVVKEGITDIGIYAFRNCSKATEVTLNNSGTISNGAFANCTALARVNIGSGVTSFEGGPFSYCSNLSTVNVTDLAKFCVIENLNCLTSGGIANKTLMVNGVTHPSTSELVIPEGVTSISKYAFRYFSNVTKIKLPESLETIVDYNFENHTYLTEITVPSTVSSVGKSAFQDCTSLQTATLNNTGNIGFSAFRGCTSLQTATLNNDGDICSIAFYECTSLQTVTLNNNGIIGSSAFEFCSALTRVNIGRMKGFEYATGYNNPFYYCSNLSIVNIADLKAFCSLTNLRSLTEDISYETPAVKTLMINGTVHPSTKVLNIPKGVTEIPKVAFRYFSNVTKIKVPEGVNTIDFYSHTYLTEITLPSTVTSVGDYAFNGCTNLERIICLAKTCPSYGVNVATNPRNITLKVPRGTASLYKSAYGWGNYNVVEGEINTYNWNMYGVQNHSLGIDEQRVLSWSVSDESVVTRYGNMLCSNKFVYDGTTEAPYKATTITAELDNADINVYNIKVYPSEVTLTDGNAYKNTDDFEVERVSYTRTYAEKYANHLQCFYVPFDVKVTDELLEDFTFYELYMVSQKDLNGNGEIEEDEPLVMVLTKIPSGDVMQANMPYYIKPKAESTLAVTAEDTKLYAATNGSVSCSTTKNEYTLIGINESTNIKGYYTMSAKGNFSYYTKDTYIGSFRWYMSVRNRRGHGEELENYARPIEIVIDGEEDTTGIADLQHKASDPKNGKIYTLDGRQVTDYETLPSGIYIVNGKKVFKK